MDIIPTILEETKEGFVYQFNRLAPYFSAFQIDIAAKDFAGHDTLDMTAVHEGVALIQQRILSGVSLDFHLMCKNYEENMGYCRALNNKVTVRNVLIHHNLAPDYAFLAARYPEFSIGAVLNSEDDVSDLKPDSPLFSLPIIQLMTVQIGLQGNPFIPQALLKIERLRKLGYRGKIFIDGGVNKDSLPHIISLPSLPDLLCVGSFLTHSDNLPQDTEYLFDFLRN